MDYTQNEWECFWCERGKVTTLPADCPVCGTTLKTPLREMSPEELEKTRAKRSGGFSWMTLAS